VSGAGTLVPTLALNTVQDPAGNNNSASTATDNSVAIDVTAPTVTGVSSSKADGIYSSGTVDVRVSFSEIVHVTNTPRIELATGGSNRFATYTSGSGSTTLVFTYTIVAEDVSADLDYTATNALTLNGGTIKDSATNNATLTLVAPGATGSLGNSKAIVIDAVAPTVTNVTSNVSNTRYAAGSVIDVRVTFSKTASATNTPQITLETGATDRTVDYTSLTGGTTLIFNYTVQAGDTTGDLDYVAAAVLNLNGGTIADSLGNNASLALPAAGSGTSLSGNKNIAIDTTAPPALTAFTGLPGGASGVIALTLTHPADTSDFDHIDIRRIGGATPPADCTAGTVAMTRSTFANGAVNDTGLTSGNYYSYRACIYDSAGNITSSNTVANVQARVLSHTVFATSVDFSVNLLAGYTGHAAAFANAYEGADYRCQYHASLASLPGIWRAIMSMSDINAKQKVAIRGTVYDRNGATVATSGTDFWDGTHASTINRTEANAVISGGAFALSGSDAFGVKMANNCLDWSSTASGVGINLGYTDSATGSWLNMGLYGCAVTGRIYCVEQFTPALTAFSAATGSGADGTVTVTLDFPADTSDYGSVKIRRLAGVNAPSADCATNGTQVANYTTFTDTAFTDSPGSPGAQFSYRACVFDLDGNLAFSNHIANRVRSKGAFHRAFITSLAYSAIMGGLTGADGLCQTRANAAILGGAWKAILSDEATNAKDHVTVTGPVYDLNDNLIASGSTDMWDGTIGIGIDRTESNTAVGGAYVFTGTDAFGVRRTGWTCSNWSSNGGGVNHTDGYSNNTGGGWLNNTGFNCSATGRLYCMEQ
jgi:hypothetical protein